MSETQTFRLVGEALTTNGAWMLDEVCEHFVEHASVRRTDGAAYLESELGACEIRLDGNRLAIDLECPTPKALDLSRNSLAEHLFYFAGEDPLELNWHEPPKRGLPHNFHEATVVAVTDVTPNMRRMTFRCADVAPFIGGNMHARLLVPPKGRTPVWPHYRADGRLGWPEGDDALLVRVYTIRAVDADRGELLVDFLQHASQGVATPGADFARDARPGDEVALLGPGGGGLPASSSILMVGDESALPAIARIAAEVPHGTKMQAIIEVADQNEEQLLPTNGTLEVRWLHRAGYPAGSGKALVEAARKAIETLDTDTFVWIACEKDDVRTLREILKGRGHNRKKQYAAWYWERTSVAEG